MIFCGIQVLVYAPLKLEHQVRYEMCIAIWWMLQGETIYDSFENYYL